MSKIVKELFSHDESMGIIGEDTGARIYGKSIKVGDFVSYDSGINIINAIVVKCGDMYTLMGNVGEQLHTVKSIVLPNELITSEIVKYRHNMTIKEYKAKQMTLEQIQKELGYHIELVEAN